MIDADGMGKKEEEEAPVSTLTDEDLDSRIAALGLGGENGTEDKSTGWFLHLSLPLSLLVSLPLSFSLSLSLSHFSPSFRLPSKTRIPAVDDLLPAAHISAIARLDPGVPREGNRECSGAFCWMRMSLLSPALDHEVCGCALQAKRIS